MNYEISEFDNMVVRIKGKYEDGCFFGSSIEHLQNEISSYYLILNTKEKTQQATTIMKERKSGLIPLTVEFHFNKDLQPIILKVATYQVDLQTIKQLKARKIQYIR